MFLGARGAHRQGHAEARQDYLRNYIINDDKLPKNVRGWIATQIRSGMPNIRLPHYDVGHINAAVHFGPSANTPENYRLEYIRDNRGRAKYEKRLARDHGL
jgi:hypothetical protein